MAGFSLLRSGRTTTILKDPYFLIDKGCQERFLGQVVADCWSDVCTNQTGSQSKPTGRPAV